MFLPLRRGGRSEGGREGVESVAFPDILPPGFDFKACRLVTFHAEERKGESAKNGVGSKYPKEFNRARMIPFLLSMSFLEKFLHDKTGQNWVGVAFPKRGRE